MLRKSRYWWAIVFCVVVALNGHTVASKFIVVFPFENETKNPTMEWIGESFVETLNEQLASPGLSPIGQEQRNAAYDRLGLPADGDFSQATLIKVGEELDADFALVGTYRFEQSEFVAFSELINLDSSRIEFEITETGPLDSLKKIQSRITWRILTHFDPGFPYSQEEFYKHFEEVPLSAFENYVRGKRALDNKSQLRYFLKAEHIDPTYSKAIFQIGKIYFQQKDYATSQLWLRRLTRTDRNFYTATFYLGLDYYFIRNFEAAAEAFSLLVNDLPLNEVFNNLGAALSRMGGSTQVAPNYQKAIDGDRGEPDFYFNLGYYFWKSGNFANAARYLRETLQLNPQDAEAAYLLANSLQAMKQADESSHYFRLASRLNPRSDGWTVSSLPPLERVKLNYDAEAYRDLKATLDSIQEQKLRGRSATERIATHIRRGIEFFDEQENREAIQEFDGALMLDPGLSEAHSYLARILEREGQWEQAVQEWKLVLQITDSVAAHTALAHLYYTLNRPQEARQEAEAALALDPDHREARDMKALLQEKTSATKK